MLVTARKPELLEKTSEVFLKLARQDAQQKGKPDPARTSTHRGLTITALGGRQGIAYCIADGRLLAIEFGQEPRATDRPRRRAGRASRQAARAGQGRRCPGGTGSLAALESDPGQAGARRAGMVVRRSRAPPQDRPQRSSPTRISPIRASRIFFGSWYEAFRKATAATASIRWSDTELAANVDLLQPKEGASAGLQGICAGRRQGRRAADPAAGHDRLAEPLARLATIWESKADLFSPETVQGFAQLDTFAGQFFGVREFGPDVLGPSIRTGGWWSPRRTTRRSSPSRTSSIPGFAIVTELNEPDSDFAQRLKVAFQTFVGLSNVDAVQKKGPPFELVSEQVDGITLATARYMVPKTDDARGDLARRSGTTSARRPPRWASTSS